MTPYAPADGQEPAQRFLLWGDGSHNVQRLKESVLTEDGVSVTATWQSPNLCRIEPGAEHQLIRLTFFYSAESDTTLTVKVSGDGGQTWNETKTLSLSSTTGAVHRAWTGFNTTGHDLRFQLEFDTDVVVTVHGYIARVLARDVLGRE